MRTPAKMLFSRKKQWLWRGCIKSESVFREWIIQSFDQILGKRRQMLHKRVPEVDGMRDVGKQSTFHREKCAYRTTFGVGENSWKWLMLSSSSSVALQQTKQYVNAWIVGAWWNSWEPEIGWFDVKHAISSQALCGTKSCFRFYGHRQKQYEELGLIFSDWLIRSATLKNAVFVEYFWSNFFGAILRVQLITRTSFLRWKMTTNRTRF